MLFLPSLRLHRRQPFQDAAGVHRLLLLAAPAQFVELLLELHQFRNARIDMRDVLVQQLIDATAIAGWLLPKDKECANFIMRHV